MNLNLFKDFFSKSPTVSTLENVVNLIKYDEKLKVFTESYRQTKVKDVKNQCQMFAVACLFEGGKAKQHVKSLTQVGLSDLDHVPPENLEEAKRRIIADPHTLLAYTTISGEGLRIIFSYEMPPGLTLQEQIKFYSSAFATGNAYYEQLLKGLLSEPPDPACKNITRLSGLCHDPQVSYCPNATPFTIGEIAAYHQKNLQVNKEEQRIRRIQAFYDKTIRPKLEAENITFEAGKHNNYVMRVGYWLAEKRYNKSSVLKWAKQTFAEYEGTEQVINSCFSSVSPSGHQQEEKGKLASVQEIQDFLHGHALLRYNLITHRVEIKLKEKQETWSPICDRTVNSLWTKMSKQTRVNASDIYRVIESDHVKEFHPFLSYLESLPDWHEGDPDYIAELADTVKVKREDEKGRQGELITFKYALKKWLVAMVAAWINPKVVNK